jgi:hypothetical protein
VHFSTQHHFVKECDIRNFRIEYTYKQIKREGDSFCERRKRNWKGRSLF